MTSREGFSNLGDEPGDVSIRRSNQASSVTRRKVDQAYQRGSIDHDVNYQTGAKSGEAVRTCIQNFPHTKCVKKYVLSCLIL